MSQQKSNVGKIIGFTCLGIIAIPTLLGTITTLAFTGNLSSLVWILLIGAAVPIIVISNKRQKKKIAAWEASQQPIAMRSEPQQSATPMPAVAPISSARAVGFETSVCQHVFTEADLKDKESVTCLCGYSYSVKNLREYARLTKRFNETQQKLVMLERALLEGTRVQSSQAPVSAPAQAARVPVLNKPAIAPQTAKPVVAPVVKRKRVALSAQQWLVMGASALSVMAGSVFVSANINNLDSFAFLLITLGVGSVTGFLAFWGRKFSVMLVNFMATFSSAMQMFSMLIIGDMLFEFAWDSAPAWWWAVVLLAVSAIAFVLARFKANFAWKLLSIASLLASASALVLGPLSDLSLASNAVAISADRQPLERTRAVVRRDVHGGLVRAARRGSRGRHGTPAPAPRPLARRSPRGGSRVRARTHVLTHTRRYRLRLWRGQARADGSRYDRERDGARAHAMARSPDAARLRHLMRH